MKTIAPPEWVDYDKFFEFVASSPPFPFQSRLALCEQWPELLHVPTGFGKTATVVLAWLWRRRYHPDPAVRAATPRRLVFCLPMRVLVDQTYGVVRDWRNSNDALSDVRVVRLLGGETSGRDLDRTSDDQAWDERPEDDMVLVGTQDQLLSRALNRGYAMSRFRWPLPFAWLNNDAMWVVDEIQLMGPGLETTAQLAGLRERLGVIGTTHTLWMSATPNLLQLDTADHPGSRLAAPDAVLGLGDADRAHPIVAQRLKAMKRLAKTTVTLNKASKKAYAQDLAREVVAAHVPGTLTLVVLNTVQRARDVLVAIAKLKPDTPHALIHSQFRLGDRARQTQVLLADGGGRIVVATQAIEAGVDVSARTLFTELAPWPSLVQRFGRCNRFGGGDAGQVFWVDVADEIAPYAEEALVFSRSHLPHLVDVGPTALRDVEAPPDAFVPHGFRRKDLLDLFDTTPDLLGNDLDVGRYIRNTDDSDVQVFWRHLPKGEPLLQADPHQDEICSVGIGSFKSFVKAGARTWIWHALDEVWTLIEREADVRPGLAYLIDSTSGGYDPGLGWTGDAKDAVPPVEQVTGDSTQPEGMADERADAGRGRTWLTLADHTDHVVAAMTELETTLRPSLPVGLSWRALRKAARFHDRGKAHEAFAAKLGRPVDGGPEEVWAKSGPDAVKVGDAPPRPKFRHELASALAYVQTADADPETDLVAYVIAAHHGRVRLSLRAQPGELEPRDPAQQPFARGCWHGDALPDTALGAGVVAPGVTLDLRAMALGPQSWLSRVLPLRDAADLGPFRLAFMEALFRVADWRGSDKGGRQDAH